MNASEKFSLTLSRLIRAPREQVFDAFTRQTLVVAWMGPRGMQVHTAEVDARVGGSWRVEMRARDGSSHVVGGQ
jgi:glutathione S-transferase